MGCKIFFCCNSWLPTPFSWPTTPFPWLHFFLKIYNPPYSFLGFDVLNRPVDITIWNISVISDFKDGLCTSQTSNRTFLIGFVFIRISCKSHTYHHITLFLNPPSHNLPLVVHLACLFHKWPSFACTQLPSPFADKFFSPYSIPTLDIVRIAIYYKWKMNLYWTLD